MLLDILAPVRCPLCLRPGPAPCAGCSRLLPAALPGRRPAGLASLQAAFAYEGAMRPLIAALKYRGARQLAWWLGAVLAPLVGGLRPAPQWVTWAPTSAARRRWRGYDQAKLLALAVAPAWGLEVVGALERRGSGHQTGKARVQRLHADLLFAPRVCRGGPVLLIDDVCTTGATLSAAAAALRRGGSGPVHGLVAARTP